MNKTRILIFLAAALAVGAASAQPGPRADRGPRGERAGGPMPPEMREQMKADMRAIRELGRAARAETDETKKKEAVEQLRAKLGEVADRIQAHQEERLAQAEERLGELKARIEDGKVRRGERIDEQIEVAAIAVGAMQHRSEDAWVRHPKAACRFADGASLEIKRD